MNQLIVIYSDIHGNFPALQAVEHDAQELVKTEQLDDSYYICLGDVVNYGPHPVACLKWVRQHVRYVVQGNHDRHVAQLAHVEQRLMMRSMLGDLFPLALWTQQQLTAQDIALLRSWPLMQHDLPDLPDWLLFHSSPEGDDIYIDNLVTAQQTLTNLITRSYQYGFFGHTHIQGYFTARQMWLSCMQEEAEHVMSVAASGRKWSPVIVNTWYALPHEQMLLNPGSVGLPRMHAQMRNLLHTTSEAAYLVLKQSARNQWHFQFRRVPYDATETIRSIDSDIRLPDYPAEMQDQLTEQCRQVIRQLQLPTDV